MTGAPTVPALTGRLSDTVTDAIRQALPDVADVDPLVRRSEHADYQSNAALALAKTAKTAPRDLAARLAEVLPTGELLASVSISGPGFVNLDLTDEAIWQQVTARLTHPRLGVGHPAARRRVVIDYSAPNVAKEMHVGHLRTTIIGDSLARLLDFCGAEVIRQNHLGDWGTQFGMLIQYIDEHPKAEWHHDRLTSGESAVSALDTLYRAARKHFEADPGFADRSRARVVALQAGEPDTLAAWRAIVAESEKAFRAIYDRLNVQLTPEDNAGESTYNPHLDDVVAELTDAGIAVESDGALCVFTDGVTGPDGNPIPLIIRKSDGGYGYATTDLATIRHRVRNLKADQILYVVDARQALHFKMIFATAKRAGWLPDSVDVRHVEFGTVLGPDGKPFKTRAGGTVRLSDLLDAAVNQARTVVAENRDLPAETLDGIAEQAGIAAVKYADLSTSRTKDYTFDVNRMVSFTGDTGVYLQYAHTRIASILRKAPDAKATVDPTEPLHAAERALALHLDAYAATLTETAELLEPHRLCSYLSTLARTFTSFYENCPVLTAETPTMRSNRLALVELTARTLRHGLDLLGIHAPERM